MRAERLTINHGASWDELPAAPACHIPDPKAGVSPQRGRESLIYTLSALLLRPGRCFISNQSTDSGYVLMEKHFAAASPRERPHLHSRNLESSWGSKHSEPQRSGLKT